MQNKQFQNQLRQEILGYSVILITIITILLSTALIAFNQVSVKVQMTESEATVSNLMTEVLSDYQTELLKQKAELYYKYMKADADEQNVYSNFYSVNSEQMVKGELILFDPTLEISFNSASFDFEAAAFKHYMSLVVSDLVPEQGVIQRVYRDRNKEYHLLLVTAIAEGEGYAAYVINGKAIRTQLAQLPNQFIIFDRFNNVLASSSSQFISGSLNKVDADIINGSFQHGADRYFSRKQPLSEELTLIIFQRGFVYTYLIRLSVILVSLLMLLLISFAFWFSKKISAKNAQSVELLSKELRQLVTNENHSISLETGDEFEIISDKINQMIKELSSAHNQNIQLLKENIQAERKMLEAQFNPHFLYNTLEVIRASIAFDPKLSNQLIISLTKILRYSIEEEMDEVILETDLKYLEEYLSISDTRFEAFNYELKIDEKALDLAIPKLFLLPIIENSLKYGFQYKEDLQIVLVITKSDQGDYLLQVSDNGQALSPARAFEINYYLQNALPMGNHHGLMNSKRRIQLMYPQAEFSLRVEDQLTIVEIRIGGDVNV